VCASPRRRCHGQSSLPIGSTGGDLPSRLSCQISRCYMAVTIVNPPRGCLSTRHVCCGMSGITAVRATTIRSRCAQRTTHNGEIPQLARATVFAVQVRGGRSLPHNLRPLLITEMQAKCGSTSLATIRQSSHLPNSKLQWPLLVHLSCRCINAYIAQLEYFAFVNAGCALKRENACYHTTACLAPVIASLVCCKRRIMALRNLARLFDRMQPAAAPRQILSHHQMAAVAAPVETADALNWRWSLDSLLQSWQESTWLAVPKKKVGSAETLPDSRLSHT